MATSSCNGVNMLLLFYYKHGNIYVYVFCVAHFADCVWVLSTHP